MDPCELARHIDNTLIKPTSTEGDLQRFCLDSLRYRFNAVYVPLWFLPKAVECASGISVAATVISFPHGTGSVDIKVREVEWAVEMGAGAVDYVINIGKAIEGDYGYLEKEAKAIKEVAGDAAVKAIVEIEHHKPDKLRGIVEALIKGGVDYIKTSTGYGARGVTVEDVRILKELVGGRVGIKAAGGIRSLNQALRLIEEGANLLGTSSGIKIVREAIELFGGSR